MANLPKRLQDIFDKKEEYINAQRLRLEKNVLSMQEKLLNKVIADIVSELDTENGQIKQTTKNIRLISKLESVYEDFNTSVQLPVVKELGKGILGINKYNTEYFSSILLDITTKKRFNSVISSTDEFMKARIGVSPKNEITSGGFLDSFITDRSLVNDLKQISTRAVTGQMPISDYKDLLKYKVIGNEQVDGKFLSYYKNYAFDLYNEYDSAYASNVSKEFKLNYAIYQGGIIEDSREFCIAHNNKVWTRKEIDDFENWHDSTGKVPSYISKFPGYKGEIHRGGFNCRHSLTWIDKITAYRLRPELKELNL